ncbi:MAG: hypothetical protein H6Q89_1214 [Myxococcaceae bacterium]|nr:hypothetical protein [Myxococcaceae bacterium]
MRRLILGCLFTLALVSLAASAQTFATPGQGPGPSYGLPTLGQTNMGAAVNPAPTNPVSGMSSGMGLKGAGGTGGLGASQTAPGFVDGAGGGPPPVVQPMTSGANFGPGARLGGGKTGPLTPPVGPGKRQIQGPVPPPPPAPPTPGPRPGPPLPLGPDSGVARRHRPPPTPEFIGPPNVFGMPQTFGLPLAAGGVPIIDSPDDVPGEGRRAPLPLDPIDHRVGAIDHGVGAIDHSVGTIDHSVGTIDHSVGAIDHRLGAIDYGPGSFNSGIDNGESAGPE